MYVQVIQVEHFELQDHPLLFLLGETSSWHKVELPFAYPANRRRNPGRSPCFNALTSVRLQLGNNPVWPSDLVYV